MAAKMSKFIEISALFHLLNRDETVFTNTHIGSRVFIERLDFDWLDELKSQCPKVEAREKVEWESPYSHRFFYAKNFESPEYEGTPTDEEKQLIFRAIVLSRIIKPTSIGYDSVWVKSFETDVGIKHFSDFVINNLNVAFTIPKIEANNTLTDDDIFQMSQLWDSLQFFLDDANEPKYRRIVRATKFHEMAYSIYFPEISHPVMHAALESMICTGFRLNKAQVTQRLPQLVPSISRSQAEDIYNTCSDFKHAAAALAQDKNSGGGIFTPSDQKRWGAVVLLRQAVRGILLNALQNRNFADILANPTLLKRTYPVYDNKGNLI
jgi:hypothetical protein